MRGLPTAPPPSPPRGFPTNTLLLLPTRRTRSQIVEDGAYSFTFDRVFGPTSTQLECFEYVAKPVVGDIMQGYNATNGTLGATVGDIQLDLDAIQPAPTTAITVRATLDAEAAVVPDAASHRG